MRSKPFRQFRDRIRAKCGCSVRDGLKKLVDEGHTATEIAVLLNVDRQRLYEYARSVGWQFRTQTVLVDIVEEQRTAEQQEALRRAAELCDSAADRVADGMPRAEAAA